MNIVLIHPYIKVRDVETYLSEPLGLLCLASYAEQIFGNGVNISILDLYALGARNPKKDGDFYCLGINDEKTICRELNALAPDLIGLTCNFTAYARDSLEVAQLVKRNFPKVPIVIGGAHPTIEAAAILKESPSIDFVAKGEGEIIFANLIRHLKGEIPREAVSGLVHRVDGRIVFNAPQKLIDNLDTLPIPDRKYIDMEAYKYFNKETIWYVRKEPVATIMTSRGCPFDCVFCSTKVVWERKWRPRSLELVFREIEILAEKYGIKEFVINDDQFMTQRKRILAFCDHYIEKGAKISFSVDAGISPWLVTAEMLKKMRKAGFYALRFPIESGCEKTLKYVKKPVKLDKTRELIANANALGFWTSSNIIIGFPYETREDALESIAYVYNSALDFTSFIIAKPNAGADMYEDFRKSGLLDAKVVRGSDFYRSDYDTMYLTAMELNDMANSASRRWFLHKAKFFANPVNFYRNLLPKLRSYEDVRYFLKVIWNIYKRKIRPILSRQFARKAPPLPARGLEIG